MKMGNMKRTRTDRRRIAYSAAFVAKVRARGMRTRTLRRRSVWETGLPYHHSLLEQ